MSEIIYKKESYEIIGICMEVHRLLGPGFLEVVYKDALEYEFQKHGIKYQREKKYNIAYKDITLKHSYNSDFVVYDKIILEVKAVSSISDDFIIKGLNYCRASECFLTIIVNFGEASLSYRRVVMDDKYFQWLDRIS